MKYASIVCSSCVALSTAPQVRAEENVLEVQAVRPDDYQTTLQQAIDEHDNGNFAEARAHFQVAHKLRPSARTLRALGKVEFELRNYGEAALYFQQALDAQTSPLDAKLRDEVMSLLRRTQVYLGQLHITVQPDSATILVDGITVATGPRAAISLVVGDHILELRALGRMPERRAVRIGPGQRMDIDVLLPPANDVLRQEDVSPRSAARGNDKRISDDQRSDVRAKRVWLWSSLSAVAVALIAGAAVFAVRSRSDNREGPIHDANGGPATGPVVEALWSNP